MQGVPNKTSAKYDLLLRGGEVIDPYAGIRGLFDVAVRDGKIAEIAASLPVENAKRVVDVNKKLVTPGLVDIHAHVFANAGDMGINTDAFCLSGGVTVVCDAGSAGASTFPAFRHFVDNFVQTRARAFVNLSTIGIVGFLRSGECSHFPYVDPEGCAQTIANNRDIAVGVKLRYGNGLVWEHSTEPLRLARQAADMAGVPLMIHVTDSPLPLPTILKFMKRGDIITHCLHNYDNGIMGPDRKVILKEVIDAQRNGVIFDCAHGRMGHFNFHMLERSLDQGFLPDTISTDLVTVNATRGPVFDLPTTMTKLLHFGVSLEDVIVRATANPARILGLQDEIGTLKPGRRADIAVLELHEGDHTLEDTDGNKISVSKRLIASHTIRDGKIRYDTTRAKAATSARGAVDGA